MKLLADEDRELLLANLRALESFCAECAPNPGSDQESDLVTVQTALAYVKRAIEVGDSEAAAHYAMMAGTIAYRMNVRALAPLIETRRRQIDALNAKETRVTPEERAEVETLYAKLAEAMPVKTQRYQAIDEQLGFNSGRTRYIVEGPRRKT